MGALDSEMSRLERRDSGCVNFSGRVVLSSLGSQGGRRRRRDDNGWGRLRLAGVSGGGTDLGLPGLEVPASHGLG